MPDSEEEDENLIFFATSSSTTASTTTEISNEIEVSQIGDTLKENSQENQEHSEEISNEIETVKPEIEERETTASTTIRPVSNVKCQDGLRANEEGKCIGKILN